MYANWNIRYRLKILRQHNRIVWRLAGHTCWRDWLWQELWDLVTKDVLSIRCIEANTTYNLVRSTNGVWSNLIQGNHSCACSAQRWWPEFDVHISVCPFWLYKSGNKRVWYDENLLMHIGQYRCRSFYHLSTNVRKSWNKALRMLQGKAYGRNIVSGFGPNATN